MGKVGEVTLCSRKGSGHGQGMEAGLLSLCELGCTRKIDNARNMCLAYLSAFFGLV